MSEIQYFDYGSKEINYLKKRDPILGKAIDDIGPIYREVIPDMFTALVKSIIGQQISTKAQQTVWARFLKAFGPISPEGLASLPLETLQACGISMRKASYISGIARSIYEGDLDLDELAKLPDDEVCQRLTQLKGVGIWTAEMLMIFSMGRKDIISQGDIAIIRGLRMLYRHRKITPELFKKYKNRYSPYASTASLYLWEISHGTYGGLVDPAPKAKAKKARAKADKK